MKKFAVTAGLFAACAATTFGVASADDGQGVVVGVDPSQICASMGITDPVQCSQALQPGVGMQVNGQAWTGYSGFIR